uniref:Uncharacterized protein n=1 Tax=Prochlorococcus marinus str. P0902-H212 TaxID=1620696 RepID=A0A0D5A2S3_PROMR|nr:hypothetical protein FA02_0224 [Prochlorococcus marinus str. P0902-H212]
MLLLNSLLTSLSEFVDHIHHLHSQSHHPHPLQPFLSNVNALAF